MMKLQFVYANTHIAEKYTRKYDLREHLARWKKAWGEEPRPKWVHIFFHTLDTISMNWYLETELQQKTAEWDVLKESFLLTFNFEDRFECIDKSLQEIKDAIFKMPEEPITQVQPEWNTQLRHALECYNVTIQEGKEDPRNISIPESRGQHKVMGPKAEVHDISNPLKDKQVNIGLEAQPKFVNIGDYWDEDIVDKVTKLFLEYQDLFPTKFTDINGIVGDLGVMKITLNPNVKPVKQHPQWLNPKYKEKLHEELDKMLGVEIIETVEESDRDSPMVVHEKKTKGKIQMCVDLIKLNDACVHDPFSTPFADDVLENVGGQEAYLFTDGFSRYHQIKIASKDWSKTTFTT